ncbi:MAG: glycoside hydrolase family 32 protein [Clostridiales bacterium]|nr:glycoside hydrolase family 32 protein [Clostridiales bacterium]
MEERILRPKYHFTPKYGWMNDPNGLVYYQGKYHLFFQYNPHGLTWDSMHWGHATSIDMMTWKEQEIALYPDEMGDIFSGSCVVDHDNVSGLGSRKVPALLAFYTSHRMDDAREMQCMAWSTDGFHFQKFSGNPIIPGMPHTPARDPHVIRNKVIGGYTLSLTTEKAIEFYHSEDLLSWKKTGEFSLPEYALHGMIECPCMFAAPTEEGEKYVLMMSMDVPETEFSKYPQEGNPHSRLMQYFVGTFDGSAFHADEEQNEVLLMDYGPDFYAGTIFSNVDKTILMAWMSNSPASMKIPTENEGFRGIQSFPRELTLRKTEKGYRLHHAFVGARNKETLLTDGCVCEKLLSNGFIPVSSYLY